MANECLQLIKPPIKRIQAQRKGSIVILLLRLYTTHISVAVCILKPAAQHLLHFARTSLGRYSRHSSSTSR